VSWKLYLQLEKEAEDGVFLRFDAYSDLLRQVTLKLFVKSPVA
jgi:hypothetical protein